MCASTGAAAKPQNEKSPLVSWVDTNTHFFKDKLDLLYRWQWSAGFQSSSSSVGYNVNSTINMFPELLSSYIIHKAYGVKREKKALFKQKKLNEILQSPLNITQHVCSLFDTDAKQDSVNINCHLLWLFWEHAPL